ncbi:GNAT family N-acetyltransferase [Pedobacter sp. Hv1]|uniref:GNAT family N-acetyltransferase n=1 Tax=Pedobacter sp. Hv1 TaxID=1740090 RepID=UPI0006D8BD3F|nr:GNAT family N-acetyltransferase [Pedobacter sp. Hv1]KQB98834.1 hypothetical protein AQF98_21065 [Pedobacter sp. Hv1]
MVTLKEIQEASTIAIQQLANNPLIAQNLKDVFPHPYALANAEEFMALAKQGVLGHVFGIFVDETFIGVCRVVPHGDIYRNNAEIGYWIGEPYWGKGYATQTVQLLTDFAFNELQVLRVFAGVFSPNKASMRVLEKAGYTLEAVLKSAIVKNEVILDEHLYRIFNPNHQKL